MHAGICLFTTRTRCGTLAEGANKHGQPIIVLTQPQLRDIINVYCKHWLGGTKCVSRGQWRKQINGGRVLNDIEAAKHQISKLLLLYLYLLLLLLYYYYYYYYYYCIGYVVKSGNNDCDFV